MMRLPLLFMMGGVVLNAISVLVFRFWQPQGVLWFELSCNPAGRWLSEILMPLLFPRGIAPALAPAVFEVLLTVGLGLECLLLGFAVQGVRRLTNHLQGA